MHAVIVLETSPCDPTTGPMNELVKSSVNGRKEFRVS